MLSGAPLLIKKGTKQMNTEGKKSSARQSHSLQIYQKPFTPRVNFKGKLDAQKQSYAKLYFLKINKPRESHYDTSSKYFVYDITAHYM